jgi:hypothetical protein
MDIFISAVKVDICGCKVLPYVHKGRGNRIKRVRGGGWKQAIQLAIT